MKNEIQNWTEKHRPQSYSDVKGQDSIIEEIEKFVRTFDFKGKDKRAILLYGPAGVGKTTLAHATKNELNFEIYELNASDFRNKEQLELKLKPALEQKSLYSNGKIILVDEVDGLSAMKDKGGLTELVSLIKTSKFPVIITANDIWDKKFSELRKKCKLVGLKDVNYQDISLILQNIAQKEKLDISNQILTSLAIKCKGDVRAAINDLQIVAYDGVHEYISVDERNKSTDIFNALKTIFKNLITPETLGIYDNVDIPLEKIFLWIEENIPNEYSGEELFNAYESLSIADVFRGRIRRQRHWRFLVYQNIFLSAGISLAKSKPKIGFTHYQKPTRILKIWTNNMKAMYKKTIITKYAAKIHCSNKKASKEFNLIKPILRNPKVQQELRLNEKECEWLARDA